MSIWKSKIRLSDIINTITADVSKPCYWSCFPGFTRVNIRSQSLMLECDTAMICANFQADLTNEMNLMDKLEFAIFEFKLSSGGTHSIATPNFHLHSSFYSDIRAGSPETQLPVIINGSSLAPIHHTRHFYEKVTAVNISFRDRQALGYFLKITGLFKLKLTH